MDEWFFTFLFVPPDNVLLMVSACSAICKESIRLEIKDIYKKGTLQSRPIPESNLTTYYLMMVLISFFGTPLILAKHSRCSLRVISSHRGLCWAQYPME